MSEFGKGSIEAEAPLAFSDENARQFLGWMFKAESAGKIDQIPPEYLAEMFSFLAQTAQEKLNQGKEKRYKKSYKGPIELMVRWASGQPYHKISEYTGKSEGTVRIALTSFAEKLGQLDSLDELISQAEISLQQKAEAMAEPAEEIVDAPHTPSCEEIARLAVQKTAEITEVEEPEPEFRPIEEPETQEQPQPGPEAEEETQEPVLMEPHELERLIDDYPMLAHMRPEEIARVVKDLRLA